MIAIEPKGKQKEVMALPTAGHFVVLGAAGSGKTTIAMLRAIHLAELTKGGKVLLVTFNRALVKYMCELSGAFPSGAVIENYHKFAMGYLRSRGKMPDWGGILDSKQALVEEALRQAREAYPDEATLKRPLNFFLEEIAFIQKFGFPDFEAYRKAERIGRRANLKRENRKWAYDVFERYLALRKERGFLYDWDDLAAFVYRELESDDTPRRYRHVVIDEGQDFSPMMIRSLAKAVDEGGSLTFFGDVSQQIYGSRLSWRDSGINSEKIWRFDTNYRNSDMIASLAATLMENPHWDRSEDAVAASETVVKGPAPVLAEFRDEDEEIAWVIGQAIAMSKTTSVGIVLRRRAQIDRICRELARRECGYFVIDASNCDRLKGKTVYLTTFHAAKGLEFDNVLIPFLSEGRFPDEDAFAENLSADEAMSNELKLLYVGITRSKYGLVLSYSGKISALLSENFSKFAFQFHRGGIA